MKDIWGNGASWIWGDPGSTIVNQYVEFRHEFKIGTTHLSGARLYICADSNYAAWLNGVFIGCGQYNDYPSHRRYDVLSVENAVRSGSNVLCVLVYYNGESCSTYFKADPGLIYCLAVDDEFINSGANTFWRQSTSYVSGSMPRVSRQLGFAFEYNASHDDNWTSKSYVPGKDWRPIQIDSSFDLGTLVERPVKRLHIKDRVNTSIISQGVFFREAHANGTTAQLMQKDFLSFRLAEEVFEQPVSTTLPAISGLTINPKYFQDYTGVYLVLDLGREEAGFIDLEVHTQAGTVIDIAHGEHLDDLRVRSHIDGRNFANRYVCKTGRQSFCHFVQRIAGRYIQLHISNVKQGFKLYYAGVRPVEYPVVEEGRFSCSDKLHQRIYDVGVRTLHLCMHEHYEDCPWREQALYSMDSRNQALCGYYCFGEYDYPLASFKLLGHELDDDGYLELCAPGKNHRTIPSFSMMWIVEVAEHLLYSGQVDAARESVPQITKMLEKYLQTLRDGLMPRPVGKRYWHFYEWTYGLNGTAYESPTAEFDAPLNMFLCLALDAASYICKECDYHELHEYYAKTAASIRSAVHRTFWDESKGVYRTYLKDIPEEFQYAELTQSLALYAKICPENLVKDLRHKLSQKNNGLLPVTLSHSIFKFEALLQEREKYAETVFDMVAKDWGNMLFNGATSFWETVNGADDFHRAGSLCHGWSAIPVYLYHRYILGVKPVKAGFKAFELAPLYSLFDKVSGEVPTPFGTICVGWEKTLTGLRRDITYPEEIKCITPEK